MKINFNINIDLNEKSYTEEELISLLLVGLSEQKCEKKFVHKQYYQNSINNFSTDGIVESKELLILDNPIEYFNNKLEELWQATVDYIDNTKTINITKNQQEYIITNFGVSNILISKNELEDNTKSNSDYDSDSSDINTNYGFSISIKDNTIKFEGKYDGEYIKSEYIFLNLNEEQKKLNMVFIEEYLKRFNINN